MVDLKLNALELQQARLNELAEGLTSPVAVVLEGRDTAGKSGTIRALTQYLPPRLFSVVLSTKPSKSTMENWLGYWTKKMPEGKQIIFYDRSWYSRALVQQINGWCSPMQYRNFMREVESWEANQTVRFGTRFIKFWLSISEEEQARRIEERRISPLKYWKLSPNDERALSYYDEMTLLKERVISRGGWETVDFNNKANGRLELLTRLNTLLGATS
jgi:polyphosphate kinase 2 (PPK2 family)